MGFFNPDTEDDALKLVKRINIEMRAIKASMYLNYGMIDGRNRKDCGDHYNRVISLVKKYERVKSNLSYMNRELLLGATVESWTGESIGLLLWEHRLRTILPELHININY